MWTLQILLAVVAGATSLEVGIPERFLRPRNFNPHPYTDVAASSLDAGPIRQELYPDTAQLVRNSIPELADHPYAYFRRPADRDGDDRAPIQFPKVPESANIPQGGSRLKPPDVKHPLNIAGLQQQRFYAQQVSQQLNQLPQQLNLLPQQLNQVPQHLNQLPQQLNLNKKYAFSYSVQDRKSGDDFSHSQAGSHAQTKGEYRVRLPDGRTQVVSYTADHRGYRADVRYDEENLVEPAYTQAIYKQPLPEKQSELYDYEVATQAPTRQYTPIHEEDYGDYQENTVSSTPSYREDTSVTGYVEQVPARTFQETGGRFLSSPARYISTSARLIGSTPSPLIASPAPQFTASQQDLYFTTPSPIKLFVGEDGQLYRQRK